MNKDNCHIFHIGMGGSRAKGQGMGCNCPENLIKLTRYQHDVLDGRIRNMEVEHWKVKHQHSLNETPKNYRHKWAFAVVFRHVEKLIQAIDHYELRNQGRTSCSR